MGNGIGSTQGDPAPEDEQECEKCGDLCSCEVETLEEAEERKPLRDIMYRAEQAFKTRRRFT